MLRIVSRDEVPRGVVCLNLKCPLLSKYLRDMGLFLSSACELLLPGDLLSSLTSTVGVRGAVSRKFILTSGLEADGVVGFGGLRVLTSTSNSMTPESNCEPNFSSPTGTIGAETL